MLAACNVSELECTKMAAIKNFLTYVYDFYCYLYLIYTLYLYFIWPMNAYWILESIF